MKAEDFSSLQAFGVGSGAGNGDGTRNNVSYDGDGQQQLQAPVLPPLPNGLNLASIFSGGLNPFALMLNNGGQQQSNGIVPENQKDQKETSAQASNGHNSMSAFGNLDPAQLSQYLSLINSGAGSHHSAAFGLPCEGGNKTDKNNTRDVNLNSSGADQLHNGSGLLGGSRTGGGFDSSSAALFTMSSDNNHLASLASISGNQGLHGGPQDPATGDFSPGMSPSPSLGKPKSSQKQAGSSNFPMKLHEILSRQDLSDVISWNPHGRSWRVLKPKAFEERVIPHYFRHGKYNSFTRQVNGWGFRRITQGPDHNSYFHEYFLRDQPEMCHKMKRIVGTSKNKNAGSKQPSAIDNGFTNMLSAPLSGNSSANPTNPTPNVNKEDGANLTQVTSDKSGLLSTMNLSGLSSLPQAFSNFNQSGGGAIEQGFQGMQSLSGLIQQPNHAPPVVGSTNNPLAALMNAVSAGGTAPMNSAASFGAASNSMSFQQQQDNNAQPLYSGIQQFLQGQSMGSSSGTQTAGNQQQQALLSALGPLVQQIGGVTGTDSQRQSQSGGGNRISSAQPSTGPMNSVSTNQSLPSQFITGGNISGANINNLLSNNPMMVSQPWQQQQQLFFMQQQAAAPGSLPAFSQQQQNSANSQQQQLQISQFLQQSPQPQLPNQNKMLPMMQQLPGVQQPSEHILPNGNLQQHQLPFNNTMQANPFFRNMLMQAGFGNGQPQIMNGMLNGLGVGYDSTNTLAGNGATSQDKYVGGSTVNDSPIVSGAGVASTQNVNNNNLSTLGANVSMPNFAQFQNLASLTGFMSGQQQPQQRQ